jgi:hypothetical protein
MKSHLGSIFAVLGTVALVCSALGQAAPAGAPPASQLQVPNLSALLAETQRVTSATNDDLGRLRVDRWKTEATQKQQFQKIADSLQRNLTTAVPSLTTEVRGAPDSVTKMFKLYNNMTVVYEYLGNLTEASGDLGKREEYEPLSRDLADLATLRQNLAAYIEQTASTLEGVAKQAAASQAATKSVQPPTKKIIIDNGNPAADTKPTPKKAKKPAATAKPSPAAKTVNP